MCRGGHTSSRSAYSRTSQSFQIRRFVSSVCSVAAPLGAGRGEGVLLMRVEECVCECVVLPCLDRAHCPVSYNHTGRLRL